METFGDQLVDFSQLWPSEQKTLSEHAARVSARGVIVEIGTAEGGSAFILHAAAGHRGVKIYSFDISPSAEAYEHLRNTSVTIVARSSLEGARSWAETSGPPIDLLFIDGSHALQHVFEDFNSWIPFLKPGGKLIFHDFDSPERGGLVHFGVHVFLNTVLRLGILDHPVHQDRLLSGTVLRPDQAKLKVSDCYQTFFELGQKLLRILAADSPAWTIVGEGQLARLLIGCLGMDPAAMPLSPLQVADPSQHYLVCARPLAEALQILRSRGLPPESMVVIDNLTMCYIIAQAFKSNRNRLLELTLSRKEMFRWEEALLMFEHAFGPSTFPARMPGSISGQDAVQLSRMISREQVKLVFLARILETFMAANL